MNISAACYEDLPWPGYNRYLFGFEKNFDYWGIFFWFVENWTLCFYFIGIYLVVIFSGRYLMRSREPFRLRGPLFLWNLSLALFSIAATARILPQMYYALDQHGFYGVMCEPITKMHRQAGSFWICLFLLSKIVELGDTVFIVLRKTPLIFLHWYHHVSVIFFSWASSAYPSNMQPLFALTNLTVHSFMYSYYALKVAGVRIPRSVSIAVTSMQLVQMMIGVFLAVYAYMAKAKNPDCCVFDQAIYIAAATYFSYFVLFVNFFYKAYVNKRSLFDETGSMKKFL